MTRRPGRSRLDLVLVARGLAASRAKAQAAVMAGLVESEGRRLDKPGLLVDSDIPLTVAAGRRYVGRGAEKLGPALDAFGVAVAGREALDVGASTGGFTQVLLERGAVRVVALDVGHGQLDWTLRNDPRVVALEGINARALRPSDLPCRPSLATIDVSFISLRQVLLPTRACLAPGADVVALVKPQFEVGRGRVGKGGIVRDPEAWREVLAGVIAFASERALGPAGVTRSPIAGAEGNVEFFVHLRPDGEPAPAETLEAALREATDGAA